MPTSIKSIDDILPQIQCKRCGYEDCYDYATGIFKGEEHNRCVPGSFLVIERLAKLLNREILPLNTSCDNHLSFKTAVINESLCIGCEKCLSACPENAIMGSKKKIHVVIKRYCNGCSLCISHCPMNCIFMYSTNNKKKILFFKTEEYYILKFLYRVQRIVKESLYKNKEALSGNRTNILTITLKKKIFIKKLLSKYKKN